MTARRAPPGPQLGEGRLRVDAARAIAKLREYQLAVRAAWVLEAIRAAVAAGATRISLTGDTNDLWLLWDGAPWPAADLPRLFDELVGPEASDARYPVRLLAAAVNSALGMDPVHVDVFAVAATGRAMRARYTPDVLAEPEGDLAEAPLRRLTAEPAAPPPGAGPGMALHLRRRFGVAVLSHLVRELPELELARAACADLAVPLVVRGVEHGRGAGSRDVVRVPLGDGLRGFLAIVDPDGAPPQAVLEAAEHGVVLATSAIDLGFRAAGRPVPVRIFVDASRLPTNASRSEVRQDLHPIATALQRARALLPAAAERLAVELAGGAHAERARAAALAMIAAAGDLDDVPRLGLGKLLELPLVRDAVGAPRPVGAGWFGAASVHTGRAPYPEELAPWLGDTLWIPPGDPGACLVDLEAVDARAVKRRARAARRELRAQRRFHAHAPRPATVLARELPRLRARLGARVAGSTVDPRRFDGLTGEICIYGRGRGGELVVLLEGRELDRLAYASPIPFAAAIDSPRVAPADLYRSAAQDAELARVEAAMRRGVLCALEAIATGDASRDLIHGEPSPAADRRLLIDGLALALELARPPATGARLAGPLIDAPLWRVAGGDGDGGDDDNGGAWTSIAELRRHAVLGVTAPGARLRPPPRRCVVEVEPRDRALLAALLPGAARLVPYDAGLLAPEPLASIDLAQGLLEERGLALAVRGPDGGSTCAAAIAPATAPRVAITHLGRRVEERAYQPALVPCVIHVDSDDVVPDAGWATAVDDGGVSRHFAGWEQDLVRAGAARLAGADVPGLLGHAPVEVNGLLGRALWAALATREPEELLGGELAAQLRARPLFRALGERDPVSARDLAARFPQELPYLDGAAEPIAGFAPLVADAALARAVGRLAGRAVRDASPDLARHRRAVARAARLAQLRAQPPLPLELPGGAISVRRDLPALRAVVGVGRGAGLELEIRVEGRPVATLTRPDELPVMVIAEVPLVQLDEELAAVPPGLEDALLRMIRSAVPELLGAIAEAQPASLADLGPARTLLAAALAQTYLPSKALAALAAAEAFPTVQGPRASLAQAARRGAVSISSWSGEWLAPDAGRAPADLDLPVLHVPAGADELAKVIERLHRHAVVDVTEAIEKLQAQRQITRGLLPRPVVHGAAPELKRRLEELGPAGAALGPGEIGLVDEPFSTALLHARGALYARVDLDVLPSVHVAIEAPELVEDRGRAPGAIRAHAQAAARLLVQDVLGRVPVVPVWLRHRLRRALLADRVGSELDGVPLFETAAGGWIDRAALARQAALFGDVWCVPRPVADPTPLDDRRVVVKLALEEQDLARRRGVPCIDATAELELDAQARANLARPRPAALALDPAISTLATVALDGDGRAAPRGVVAVLAPEAALHRGVLAHRELHPFEPAADECAWPTRAIVDDARLAPDRTWAHAARDAAWEALLAAIRDASEDALRGLAPPPPRSALASEVITAATCAELATGRRDPTPQLRGRLWLDGPPGPGRVQIVHTTGDPAHATTRGALHGTLHVLGSYEAPWIRAVIEEACAAVHARLLAELAARPDPSELVQAHLAHGVALGRLAPADAPALRLGCFRPRPVDAHEWDALCRSRQRLPLVAPDASADELSVTDDGTAVARVVLDVLGDRAYRGVPAPVPTESPEERAWAAIFADERDARALARPGAPRAEPAPPRAPRAPRPAHALDPLVAAVGARLRGLGLAPPSLAIDEHVVRPLASYHAGEIALAGQHPQLRAIAAALAAQSPWSASAVDALVAHVVTVLNVALTSVTDAAEAHALGLLLRRA